MAERESADKGGGAPKAPAAKSATPSGREAAQGQSRELTGGASGGTDAASGQAAELASWGGAPLPDDVQGQFEGQLGADLSAVRVHANADAGMAAAGIGAEAVAVGQDIHGSQAALDPSTSEGAERLAHEVVHTVQHQAGGAQSHGYTTTGEGDAVEREAVVGAKALVAGEPFTVRTSGGAAVARDKASVEAKLDATPFSAAETLALIQTQGPADQQAILADTGVTDKLVNKLSGGQMATALRNLSSNPATWTSSDALKKRLTLLRRAGADPTAAQRWLDWWENVAAARVAVAQTANLRTWLATVGGPLALFRGEASGLSAAAMASAAMMSWITSTATAPMLLRAAANANSVPTAVTAIDNNGGWGWLSALPNGAGLTPDQMANVETLWLNAAGGSAAETALAAKMGTAPLSPAPADALTQLQAMLSGSTGTEANILTLLGSLDPAGIAAIDLTKVGARLTGANLAQGLQLLGRTPVEIATQLAAMGVVDGGPILSMLAVATLAERSAVAGDATASTYVKDVTGITDPRSVYAVQLGEEPTFFGLDGFVTLVIDRLTPLDALEYLTNRDAVSAFGTWCDAHAFRALFLISSLPPKDQVPADLVNNPRAVALVTSDAMLAVAITTYFADTVSGGAISTSTPIPPEALQGPLERLDALLDGGGAATEVLQACGALVNPENHEVVNDAARLAKMTAILDGEQYYQAGVAMRLLPQWQIRHLAASGDSAADRVQSVINAASAEQKMQIVADGTAVAQARSALANAPPLNAFGYTQTLPVEALQHTAFATWLAEEQAYSDLLRLYAGDDTNALKYAAAMDANGRWGWLDALPTGDALLPDELAALARLRAASTFPEVHDLLDILAAEAELNAVAPEDAFEELVMQLSLPFAADGDQCVRLAIALDDTGKTEAASDAMMESALFALDGPQMCRYVQALSMPLVDQLEWLGRATGGTPDSSDVAALVNGADATDQLLALLDVGVVSLLSVASPLGPMQALPKLSEVLAQAVVEQAFWTWLVVSTTSLELLRVIAGCGDAAGAVGTLKAASQLDTLDQLPRGMALRDTARVQCDTVMEDCDDVDCEKKIFSARFDQLLTGDWASTEREDLVYLYNLLKALPLEQVTNNGRLERFNRTTGGGGSYGPSTNQVNMGADLTYTWTQYGPDTTDAAHELNETVKKFDTTTRHEVGHGVDAMLGERTSIVYDWAGWHTYAENDIDSWLAAMDGWNANGGIDPTPAQKLELKEVIAQYMNAGRLKIRGPGFAISGLIGPDHVWHSFSHVRIVSQMNNNGMGYENAYAGASNVFSVNYYYNRYMQCSTIAGTNAPRHYTTFAPEEWFADMYGEFYREYDGTPATEEKLGGHCPAPVKSWFMTNVHRIGRSPHDLEGQSTPEGTHAAQPSGG